MDTAGVTAFFIPLNAQAQPLAAKAMHGLRRAGIAADTDYAGRSAKGQMKQANRLGASFAVIIGEDEIASDSATVKNMSKGEQEQVKLEVLQEHLLKRLK